MVGFTRIKSKTVLNKTCTYDVKQTAYKLDRISNDGGNYE